MTAIALQELLKRNPVHPKHGVPVPLTLICNVTGKETKYSAPEYIANKIKEAGSLEKLLIGYRCRGAGKVVEDVIKPLPIEKTSEVITSTEIVDSSETIHREYKNVDGSICHVYHPRQNTETLQEVVHDYRKMK